jgi:hypothetical protein
MENATIKLGKQLEIAYNSANLGFNITLPSWITKEGLGWKHNIPKALIFNPYIIKIK